MKKSLIALAVAGAVAVPSIASADATLYGSFRIGMTDAKGDSLVLKDQSSRVGIRGTVDLGLEDTKGLFLWESALNMNSSEESLGNMRYAHVGATGSWGTILAGKMDHPSVTMVSDYVDFSWQGDYTTAHVGQEYHAKQGNTLAYASPDYNGLQFVVGGVFAGDALSSPTGLPDDQKDKTIDGYNMGLQYAANDLYAAVAYGNVKSGKSVLGDYAVNQTVWGMAAGYSGVENLDLRVAYERLKDKTGGSEAVGEEGKANAWTLAANYDIDATSIYAMYGNLRVKPDNDENGKGSIYTLGVSHSLGNGALFAEFVNYGKDLKEENGRYTTVGYVLNF